MSYTLFDLSYRTARRLQIITEGIATAGAVGSLTDTVGLQNVFVDDYFIRGGLWLLYDAAGAGAAPQGEYARISDFVKTTGVVSLAANLTQAIAAGDRYAISRPTYAFDLIISKINEALAAIPVPVTDITSVTTAIDQTEYSLPAAFLDEGGLEVWIQRYTGDANDNRWVKWHPWYIQDPGTGNQKLLVMHTQPPYAYALKLVYWIPHPPLYVNSDKLRESVDLNRVIVDAAYRCMLWKKSQFGDSDPDLANQIKEIEPWVEIYKWRSPARKDTVKLATLGANEMGIEVEDV